MSPDASPTPESSLARLIELADACVLCGLCLPHCPTYQIATQESESPRGRIMLARALASSPGPIDASTVVALDHCLGCGRCERVCPAQVRYSELLALTRAELRRRRAEPVRMRVLLWASRHPREASRMLRWLKPLRALLPRRLRPVLATASAPLVSAPPAPPATSIGLLTGCVASSLDAAAHAAALRLLQACGHAVDVPKATACCGSLARHAGRLQQSEHEADAARSLWQQRRPQALLSIASGCHAGFAAALSSVAPVLDVFAFLSADAGFRDLPLRTRDERVALHLPCTQRATPAAAQAVRMVLSRIPGLTVHELADTGCCGAAGAHVLLFPDRADALREPLLDAALASGATTLVTTNIGCRLHLQAAAALAGIRIRHPLELIAEALP
jgi:glycolate oxidase iron-sulfur subunit